MAQFCLDSRSTNMSSVSDYVRESLTENQRKKLQKKRKAEKESSEKLKLEEPNMIEQNMAREKVDLQLMLDELHKYEKRLLVCQMRKLIDHRSSYKG